MSRETDGYFEDDPDVAPELAALGNETRQYVRLDDLPGRRVVVICGSLAKFETEMRQAAADEHHAGRVAHYPAPMPELSLEEHDERHRRLIDVCDEILVVAPDGYVGDRTLGEIMYAARHHKPVRRWTAGDCADCGGEETPRRDCLDVTPAAYVDTLTAVEVA